MIQVKSKQPETTVPLQSLQQIQKNVTDTLKFIMGDNSPEILDEMSTIFIEDAIPLIGQIKDGYNDQNYDSVFEAAHTLKGSSAAIGLEQLADLCLAIELCSRQQKPDNIGGYISSLESKYVQIQEALRTFIF
jgi:HPt (histidine-containing phosphotransfer) domain-containing protein